jgi:hypothetical protein
MVTNDRLRDGAVAWAAALAGVVFLTGCIGTRSGGGPLSREKAMQAYGRQLGTLSAQERSRFAPIEARLGSQIARGQDGAFKGLAIAGSPSLRSRVAAEGTGLSQLVCGFCNAKSRYVAQICTRGDAVSLYTREDLCIPGYPLVWPLHTYGSRTYLADSGEQIGGASFLGLGLAGVLGGYTKGIAPAYDKQNAARQIREARQFNVTKMTWLAAGLLGCGRSNHTYYGQLLWIAFPVGHTE